MKIKHFIQRLFTRRYIDLVRINFLREREITPLYFLNRTYENLKEIMKEDDNHTQEIERINK